MTVSPKPPAASTSVRQCPDGRGHAAGLHPSGLRPSRLLAGGPRWRRPAARRTAGRRAGHRPTSSYRASPASCPPPVCSRRRWNTRPRAAFPLRRSTRVHRGRGARKVFGELDERRRRALMAAEESSTASRDARSSTSPTSVTSGQSHYLEVPAGPRQSEDPVDRRSLPGASSRIHEQRVRLQRRRHRPAFVNLRSVHQCPSGRRPDRGRPRRPSDVLRADLARAHSSCSALIGDGDRSRYAVPGSCTGMRSLQSRELDRPR